MKKDISTPLMLLGLGIMLTPIFTKPSQTFLFWTIGIASAIIFLGIFLMKENEPPKEKKGCDGINGCECDCHLFVGGSGKACPECEGEDE